MKKSQQGPGAQGQGLRPRPALTSCVTSWGGAFMALGSSPRHGTGRRSLQLLSPCQVACNRQKGAWPGVSGECNNCDRF